MKKVSVIIRTKNEEFWIARCLEAIKNQIGNFDIEIIIVDNSSSDFTIQKALKVWPDAKIVNLDVYNPSASLNLGVRNSNGEYCICISAHCIPENEMWLESLVKPLENPDICASYGRQIPLKTSAPNDKRDLWITFGLDDVVQTKNPFLHNANSAYRKEDLVRDPFDENLTNIEDRSWGQSQINMGKKIYYTSRATVYHNHGIHQSGDATRLDGVIGMMDMIHGGFDSHESYYGQGERFTLPSKILLIMVSNRYGNQDVEELEKKAQIIKSSFEGWDIFCLPSLEEYTCRIKDAGFRCLDYRSISPDAYNKSLIEDISTAVNEMGKNRLFWDLVAFFDIRNTVPNADIIRTAEERLMIDESSFVFGGQKSFTAEHEKDCGERHTLTESGWTRFFKMEELKPIIELSPSRLLLAKSEALREISKPFQNYSVVFMDD